MAERHPLPWVLSWDANGELELHDRYDLLLSTTKLEKACSLVVSPSAQGSDGSPPSCRFHGPPPGCLQPGCADPGTDR